MNVQRKLISTFCSAGLAMVLSTCAAPTSTISPIQPTPTSLPPTSTVPPPTASPAPTVTATPEVVELNPSPRGYVSMAYDSESKQIILFGGQSGIYTDPANFSDETWAYDVTTNTWKNMRPTLSPKPGGAGSLVYDIESDRIILSGNAHGVVPSSITYSYDFNSNTWTRMKATGPTNHLGLKMAYDAESDRVILFGGYSVSSDEFFDDTWAYDFNSDTWTEMKPTGGPVARNFHTMTYDSRIDRVIMWGGDTGDVVDSSIWSYDYNTNTWEQRSTSGGPNGRYYGTMAYDSVSDQILLFGGGQTGSNEMWAYDYNANTWTKLEQDVDPGKLSRHAFEYVPDVDRFVLFGGQLEDQFYTYTQSTWIYDFAANEWTETTKYP